MILLSGYPRYRTSSQIDQINLVWSLSSEPLGLLRRNPSEGLTVFHLPRLTSVLYIVRFHKAYENRTCPSYSRQLWNALQAIHLPPTCWIIRTLHDSESLPASADKGLPPEPKSWKVTDLEARSLKNRGESLQALQAVSKISEILWALFVRVCYIGLPGTKAQTQEYGCWVQLHTWQTQSKPSLGFEHVI